MPGFAALLYLVALVALLIPGVLVYFGYNHQARYWGYKQTDGQSPTAPQVTGLSPAIAWGVVISPPAHLGGITILWLASNFNLIEWTVDTFPLVLLAPGLYGNGPAPLPPSVLAAAVVYLTALNLASYMGGRWLAKLAQHFEWDRRLALHGPGGHWHRLLAREELDNSPDGIVVSLTVSLAQKVYVYGGLLEEYFVDVDGNLQTVVLSGAYRRPIWDDEERNVYSLPGERFVVHCRNVETVDIDYFWLANSDSDSTQ